MAEEIIAVIPARWASSRFPGKPLTMIAGKPMVQWVYERASLAKTISRVIVATDDDRIVRAVQGFGGDVEITPAELPSGTDRTAWVCRRLECSIVVNVQGDEPLIEPDAVDLVAQTLVGNPAADMATLARRITDRDDLENPNKARVIVDKYQRALYFSRAVVPFARDVVKDKWINTFPYYDHIGIYAYRRPFLFTLTELPPSQLEQIEKLEQLRALENGYTIQVGLCPFNPICVDVPDDVRKVERRMKELA